MEVDFGEGARKGAPDDLRVHDIGGGALETLASIVTHLKQLKIDTRL
jgi:hypothetical protein